MAPHTNWTVLLDPFVATSGHPTGELIVVRSTQARTAYWYFAEDLDLAIPPHPRCAGREISPAGPLLSGRGHQERAGGVLAAPGPAYGCER